MFPNVKLVLCSMLAVAAINAEPIPVEDKRDIIDSLTEDVGSAFGQATSFLGSLGEGIYGTVTSFAGSEYTVITSNGGEAITLAQSVGGSAGGVVTSFAGHQYTVITSAVGSGATQLTDAAVSSNHIQLTQVLLSLGGVALGAAITFV